MEKLIGKKIEKIFIDGKYQEKLQFITDKGIITYGGYGDCCSETYFADLINVSNILGHIVEKVEEMDLMEGDVPHHNSRQEEDEIYGYKLYTEAGTMLVVFRNSSNGCYGGGIEDSGDEIDNKLEIIKDYSAE